MKNKHSHLHAESKTSLRLRYQTIEFDGLDIHVRTLRDRQQYSDDQGHASNLGINSAVWPLFGVIWDSGLVLAHLMNNIDVEGKKILEIGCGIALSSLVLNTRSADITATDYHPEVESFLRENVNLNHGKEIPFIRTAWEDDISRLGSFDLIIGSDLLYQRDHVSLLSRFVNQHACPQCEVIIVDPGRGNHSGFSKNMIDLGYILNSYSLPVTDFLSKPFRGQILHYSR